MWSTLNSRMENRLNLQTRLAIGFASGAVLNVLLLAAALYGLSLVKEPFFFFYFSSTFLLLTACLGYLLGRYVGRRFEREDAEINLEMRDQLETIKELVKANEFLETEAFDLKNHRKALLSIMEDAERYNAELSREIAEHKLARAEVAMAKDNMELILHGGDLGYWDWNFRDQSQRFNARFAAMLSSASEQLTANPGWREHMVHADDLDGVTTAISDHLEGRTEAYTIEYRIQLSGEDYIWVIDRGKVIERDQDRKPLRMVGTLLDITDRKEYELEMKAANRLLDKRSRALEENQHIIMGMMEDANHARDSLEQANRQLLIARKKAEEATRAKSEFLASMSHEIRTPMNGIIGTTSLFADTSLTLEQQEYLRIIQTSSDALLTLLNDILDFSKIEAGKLTLAPHPFDLRETCEHISELLTPTALKKGIDLILRYSPDTPPWVLGDAGRIRQIIMNLASNALKFTREGYVYINVYAAAGTEQETTIHFSIEDTGIGIAKAETPKLFHKFSQADSSSTREFGGSGLGLAICKQLVSLMNGKIGVTSEPGKGSSFWFRITLPIATPPHPAPIDQSIFKKEPVVVVAEQRIMSRAICEWLSHWGLEAHICLSVGEAAQTVRENDCRIALIEEQLAYSTQHPFFSDPEFRHVALLIICSITNRDFRSLDRAGLATNLVKPIRLNNLLAKTASTLDYTLDIQPQPRMAPTVEVPGIPRKATFRILVTEDNPVNQTVAKRILIKNGIEVDVAGNGEVALQKITEGNAYDLILMDCQMPRMDGYEATRQIRNWEREGTEGDHIPIIALTANAMQGDRDKCLEAGMDDYIPKPVKKEALLQMVQRFLG